MKALVTGGAGYVGSTLVPLLLETGHDVTVLDRFFFGEGTLPATFDGSRLRRVRGGTRLRDGKHFDEDNAAVDIASRSNGPAGSLNPWKTYRINDPGRCRFAFSPGQRRYIGISRPRRAASTVSKTAC